MNHAFDALTDDEQFFKEIYLAHRSLHPELPHTLAELDRLTNRVPEYRQLRRKRQHSFPESDVFSERTFARCDDIVVLLHERYSPCFIHTHDYFELSYVLAGSCTNHIAGETITQKTGDLSIISLHTPHAVSVFSDDTVLMNLLIRSSTFEQTFFGSLTQRDVLSSFFARALYTPDHHSYLLFQTGEDADVRRLMLQLFDEYRENKTYADRMLRALVTMLFATLLRSHEHNLTVPNPTGSDSDPNIMFILNYILAHYQTLSLHELASFFHYSERQLTRILKDYTGKSFTAVIQEIRLQRACELLCNPDLPIAEIAAHVGYSNVSYFYRIFKNRHHMSPADYRREHARYSSMTSVPATIPASPAVARFDSRS